MNIGQRSRSQGNKVHNIATRQPCGTVLLLLCRRATRRCRTAVSSHNDTTVQDCLVEGDRMVGVSYMYVRTLSCAQPLAVEAVSRHICKLSHSPKRQSLICVSAADITYLRILFVRLCSDRERENLFAKKINK